MIYYGIGIIIILIILDQISKKIAEKILKEKRKIKIINGILELKYAQNFGAAYNIFEKHRFFLLVTNIVILVFLIFIYMQSNEKSEIISYSFILGGGIGNFYSRITKKYVFDFLYIKIKKFPIFNFADIFILIGLIIYVLNYF